MNTSKDSTEEQDPEYITSEPTENIQQQLYEEIARKNASDKIKEIIDKEFSTEIEEKEKEILLVQDRLHTALKTLHLLRYVIITDYYNRKQCITEQKDDLKQTRIHPAIKELLGKTPKKQENYTFDPSRPSTSKENFFFEQSSSENDSEIVDVLPGKHFNGKNEGAEERSVDNKRKISTNKINEEKYEINENKYEVSTEKYPRNDENRSQQQENDKNFRKKSLKESESDEGPPRKIPRYIPPKSRIPESQAPSRGVHHKVRRRIVVGNISKWIPPEWREDSASHKWTMYVQGSKEEEEGEEGVRKKEVEIKEFVSKVRFFLHPSYRPNDVVEVTSSPFYLSRRGWGEFPLRVQLHFINPLNKPMDIIHHLKLDRTYTGLQTWGSETIVDIWIKNSEIPEPNIQDCDDKSLLNRDKLLDNEGNDENIQKNDALWKKDFNKSYHHIFMEHDYTKNNDFYKESKDIDDNMTIAHSPQKREEKVKRVDFTNTLQEECLSRKNVESEEESEDFQKYVKNNHSHCDENLINGLKEFKPKNGLSDDSKININIKSVLKSLESNSEVLKPLEITIPSTFESLKNLKEPAKPPTKKIVLLNDNKIISTNFLSSDKSIRPMKSISLLKNPGNMKNNMGNSCKKNSFINIQINPAKSVLLDTNSYVPTLQIAQPLFVNVNNEKKNNRKQKIVIGKDKFKIWSRKQEFENVIKEIIDVRIQETELLMRFILRRIPIVTENASDVDYKRMHPYIHKSEKEFLNFHLAKQRALEWFRAKEVQSYLLKKNIPENEIWTIKEIIWWCRLRGYTPVKNSIVNINLKISKNLESDKKSENSDFFNTCTESSTLRDWIEDFKDSKKIVTCLDNEIIDVESIDDGNEMKINEKMYISKETNEKNNLEIIQVPKTSLPMYSYVCETARKIGVTIEPEEIVPGVSDCSSGRIIMKVVECLMQDLLRLSLAEAWERNDGNCPDSITLTDVRRAILSREEFDIFTNSGLGSSTIQ